MAKKPGSATDPLWYKDAIIYELHVKAFADGNNDGIGDFIGLMQKLDYLQDLGVTCIWLLPFFPSPLRDDGYDIADYMNVHPGYGTMDDFTAFLNAAHERSLQVMIELVINHTSDQHPWFQTARRAPAGSPERNFYVWSDTDQIYKDARIIFTDTEKSNWTWDPVAQAYFWHRFFSHQPDLNFDNPKVTEEVIRVMRFWLDLGVDGLRMDAIPYLVERDGTNCENLPETHVIIKQIRAAIDADYSNRMVLAEANQWPSDVRPYFGDGDECHMAFHFPVMPRIYMALRQEDRLPITDIMAQTPDIPDSCQWGLFLRNHDELTLEMVTSDERDYMYQAYSADPRTRINLGIRRRLAPLMDNNRRRIELLNSLLFSLPGTPIIYYGDEIGMGDNVYLGDRNGVRTPMQWNPDRNAGFSRCNPAMLYSPVIMDPVWGYEAVNVEAEQSDPSSLLNWMRNMVALRKLFRVFGRGTLQFLHPENRKILAYLRKYDGEQILCVTNLSRFAQPVDLDLAELSGMVPIEMIGYVEFPAIKREPYRLTLGAYGFLWLELHGTPEATSHDEDDAPLRIARDWQSVFEGSARARLESSVLPAFLQRQRWFGAKSRTIRSTRVADWGEVGGSALTLVDVEYERGEPDRYLVPMSLKFGEGGLQDGVQEEPFCCALLNAVEQSRTIPMHSGTISGEPGAGYALLRGEGPLPLRRSFAEQSNSSLLYGDRLILKLFRRQHNGPNPDVEIGRYLTEKVHYDHIAPFGGSLTYTGRDGESSAIGIVQGLVPNEGDAWNWTLEELDRYYEHCAHATFPDLSNGYPQQVRDFVGAYADSACTLGRRTGELHLALASPTGDEAFAPEPYEPPSERLRHEALQAFELLKDKLADMADDLVEMAATVLGRRKQILDRIELPAAGPYGSQIRTHGDFHLGQVLRVRNDFVILDFEGEPARSLGDRRAKATPVRDVAGMLRSFSYAANATMMNYTTRHPEGLSVLEPWARLWERVVTAQFLSGYRGAIGDNALLPANSDDFKRLLDACLFEKALYELMYEMNNRPTWVRIPLAGIMAMVA
jgi:maltose alpha-D-glucosyltransferase/alpha-amylase